MNSSYEGRRLPTERFAVAAVATVKQLNRESAYQIAARGPNKEGDPPKADPAAESMLAVSVPSLAV